MHVITDTSKQNELHGGFKNEAKNPVQMHIVVFATARDRARTDCAPSVPNIQSMSDVVSAHKGVRGETMVSLLDVECKGSR